MGTNDTKWKEDLTAQDAGEAVQITELLLLHMGALENRGYSRKEVVSVDFEKDAVLFYMLNGDTVRIARTQAALEENTGH